MYSFSYLNTTVKYTYWKNKACILSFVYNIVSVFLITKVK